MAITIQSKKKNIPIIIVILLALLTDSMTVRAMYLLAPFVRTELGISTIQIGYLMSILIIGTMLTVLPIGSLMERVNVRLAYGLILTTIGFCYLVISFFFSYRILIIVLLFIGFLRSGLIPLSNRVITESFDEKWRGTVTGILFAAFPAGGFVGAVILPSIGNAYSSRAGYIFLGILAFISGLSAWVFLSKGSASRSIPAERRWTALASWTFVILAINYTLFALSTTTEAFITLFMVDAIKKTVVIAGTFFGLISIVGIAGRLLWGYVGDRYFRRNRWWILAFTSFVLMLSTGLLSQLNDKSPTLLIILSMVGFGLSAASAWPVMTTLVGDVAGVQAVATGTAIMFFLTNITDSSGPVLFGWLLEWSGSYHITMAVYAIFPFISTIGFLVMAIYSGKSSRKFDQKTISTS